MNDNPKKPVIITFTGMFTFAQDELEQLMQQLLVASRVPDCRHRLEARRCRKAMGNCPA